MSTSAEQYGGPWSRARIDEFLAGSGLRLRLALQAGDGYPRLVSLWYALRGASLCCVTHRSARLLRWLDRDARCGFEVATNDPPYHGVRGTADAEVRPLGDDPLLAELLQAYLGTTSSPLGRWLLSRQQEEMLIVLTPRTLCSWDYRQRMTQ